MQKLKIIIIYIISFIFFLGIIPTFLVEAGFLGDTFFHISQIRFYRYSLILSLTLIIFGLFWMIWAILSVIFIGRGNPQEIFGKEFLPSAKRLIVVGPYYFTRNPMIFGWLLIMVGIGIYFGSISLLLIVLPLFVVGIVFYLFEFEEPKLIKKFSKEYIEYRNKVPMLIPFK